MGRSRGSAVWTRASGQASWMSAGSQASATWLGERGVTAPTGTRWHIEVLLDVLDARVALWVAAQKSGKATATK